MGAGPGDLELLLLRAWRLIQSATVLLVDDLVSADIMQFASARLGLTQASGILRQRISSVGPGIFSAHCSSDP
ncbi:Uroporphyrinogen-III C-methyltransferase [compost metagenome]